MHVLRNQHLFEIYGKCVSWKNNGWIWYLFTVWYSKYYTWILLLLFALDVDFESFLNLIGMIHLDGLHYQIDAICEAIS